MSNPDGEVNGDWTVQRLLTWTTEYFSRQSIDEPRLASELLLAHATGWRRIDLYARFDQVPGTDVRTRFRELVKRAATHEPVAYLVGEKEFFSLALRVTPDVLIPRVETETLVEVTIDHCERAGLTEPVILDVGTGSGCAIIAIAKQIPGCRAIAIDISASALAVAEENATRHGVDERISFAQSDGFMNLAEERFDVVISNPPYVAAQDFVTLERVVRDFEPRMALTDDADGFSFYRMLAGEGGGFLAAGGCLLVEVAGGTATQVRDVFTDEGWSCAGTWNDRVEGHERVVMFERTDDR